MDYTKAQGTRPEVDLELMRLAPKYVWWESPEVAIRRPERIIAQVMNIGDFDDVQTMVSIVGDNVLRDILANAEIGQFNARSWHYWHYRLGLAHLGEIPVPPMPARRIK